MAVAARERKDIEPVRDAPARRIPVTYVEPGRERHTKGRVANTTTENGPLLDPITAYAEEAERMKMAGPRRRITADDLDRIARG